MENEILIGYEGKTYTISELQNKATEFAYGENLQIKHAFEAVYNNEAKENLDGEIWVRLSQKGWNRYFASTKGRVRWLDKENKLVPLKQVDEIRNGKIHYGYLVFDPKQLPNQIQHNFHIWRIIAMAFLGLGENDSRIVHHINNNGYDCRPENLILVTEEEHKEIHSFLKRFH